VRRFLVIAVTTMLVAATLSGVASADPAPPTILSANSKFDDLGVLQIRAAAEARIDGLTAHIVSFDTGAEVAVVHSFSLISGTLQDGTFSTIDPIQLTQLGIYRVDVDAIDTLGQVTTRQFAGTLDYLVQPSFSALFFNRTTITFSQRTIKVEGTLSGKWPADRRLLPLGHQPVLVGSLFDDPSVEVTTGADGRFTALLTLNTPDDLLAQFNRFGDIPGYTGAATSPLHITAIPSKTRFSMTVSPTQVNAGEPVMVSGQLTWRSPDGWQPLADRQVGLLACQRVGDCPTIVDVPHTDADGRFQVSTVPFETGFYQVGFFAKDANGNPDPFLADILATADIAVLQPATFSDFAAARDSTGQVATSGHLQFGDFFTPDPIPVQIQYKAPDATVWTTIATIDSARWDGTGGYFFSATLAQPNAGRWRAVYPGVPRFFQSATSTKILIPALP
jgi:hypothetical protein